jgi:transposase
VAPRPVHGSTKDGHPELKQVLLRLGVRGDGGLPRRFGLRDGQTSESPARPVALEECLALGLPGGLGMVADSKASSQRTLGLCLEKKSGLVTRVPRTWAIRQALEAWGPQQARLPVVLEKPGHPSPEAPRCWRGQRVRRRVEVEDADGHTVQEASRFVVVHASALAQQETTAAATAHAKEAERVAAPIKHVPVQQDACAADAEAVIAVYAGRAPGRRGRWPRPWRSPTLS